MISVVGVHTEDGLSASPLTVTYADIGSVAAGDLLLARVVSRSTTDLPTGLTPPAGMTFVDVEAPALSLSRALYRAEAGAETSAEWVYSNAVSGWSVTYIVLRGAEVGALEVDPAYNSDTSFGSAEPPGVTTLTDGAMIVCGGDVGDNRSLVSLSSPQGFSLQEVFDTSFGSDHSVYTATKLLASAGAQTPPTFQNDGGSVTFYGWAFAVAEGASAPSAPTNPTATAVSASQINVSWDDVADETSYRVERSADGSSGWSDVSGVLAADTTSYFDTGLAAETEYFYRVVASNALGDSDPSSVVSATTLSASSSDNRMGSGRAIRKPPR